MRNLVLGLLSASLVACSGEPRHEAANQAETPAPPVNGTPSADRPSPIAANQAVEAPTTSIPAALQGRWGLVPADCTSTRGDAKGLLQIDATMLRFYESRATLTRIVESDPSRIVADFAFTGEGQTWQRQVTLEAQDNGQALIRRESGGEDAMPGPLRYRKCG